MADKARPLKAEDSSAFTMTLRLLNQTLESLYCNHEQCRAYLYYPNSKGSGWYFCTREKDHDGPHVAHYFDGSPCPIPPWLGHNDNDYREYVKTMTAKHDELLKAVGYAKAKKTGT